jgi:hypothetical protein
MSKKWADRYKLDGEDAPLGRCECGARWRSIEAGGSPAEKATCEDGHIYRPFVIRLGAWVGPLDEDQGSPGLLVWDDGLHVVIRIPSSEAGGAPNYACWLRESVRQYPIWDQKTLSSWMGAYAGISASPAEAQRVEHLSEALSASAAAMLTAREMITEMTALRLENGFLRERVALLHEEREALLTLVGKQQRHLQEQEKKA